MSDESAPLDTFNIYKHALIGYIPFNTISIPTGPVGVRVDPIGPTPR